MSETLNPAVYTMGYMDEFKSALRQYANFGGRTGLAEFWRFMAVREIILDILDFIYSLANDNFGREETVTYCILVIYVIAYFGLALPTLAATCRRLHDVGKSGWTMLTGCIPVAGFFIMLALLVRKGDVNTNSYGERVGYIRITPEMAGQIGMEPTPSMRHDIWVVTIAVIIFILGFTHSIAPVSWLIYNALGAGGLL